MTFSAMRQSCGGNYSIDAVAAQSAINKAFTTGMAYCSINCNVRLEKECQTYKLLEKRENSRKPNCFGVLENLSDEQTQVLHELLSDRGRFKHFLP